MIVDYFNIYSGNYERFKLGRIEEFKEWFTGLTETELYNFRRWLKQNNYENIKVEDLK